MKKLKLQGFFLIMLSVWVLISIVRVFLNQHPESIQTVSPPGARSEIGAKENVQSRREYEEMRLTNPNTGQVPLDIRKQELNFAKAQFAEAQRNGIARQPAGTDASENSEALDWVAVGPENFGGRTRALAIDVTDERILLAGGVSGGVWRSEDSGASWEKTTTPYQLQSVTAIVQDTRPGKENIWYYGTGELVGNSTRAAGAPFRGDGMFKSTDGGRSWQPLVSTQTNNPGSFDFPFNYVWALATNPNSTDDEIYAAIFGGIVRSTDGGQSWETVLGGDLLGLGSADLNEVTAIFYTDLHIASDGVFYATLSTETNNPEELADAGGFYRSNDGENWQRIFGEPGVPTRRTEIGSSPSNPDIVYFISDTRNTHTLRKLDRSANRISVMNGLPDGSNDIEAFESQTSYDLFVRVHPTDENTVFVGGTNLYRSTDGFATRNNTTWIGGYDPDADGVAIYPNHHPDQHDLLFLPSNPNVILSANDGGVFRSVNALAEEVVYEPLNNGYVTTQFYTGHVSRFPRDNFILGGLQDNGSLVTGTAFAVDNAQRIIGGDGGYAASTRFGIYYYLSFQNSRIFRLTFNDDFGLTSFARVDPIGGGSDPEQPYLFINPYMLDPNNGNRMYLAGGDVLWRNRNLSQIPSGSQEPTSVNWAKLTRTSIPSGVISAVEVSSTPENIVFYGTSNGRLFKLEDAHADSYSVTDVTADVFPTEAYVSSISVNPVDADELLVTFSNYGIISVFQSLDGGSTFTDVSGNLEEQPDGSGNGPSVRWARVVPKTDGSAEYFLATSTGLYSTTSLTGGTVTWHLESPDEIGNSVVNMIDYRRQDGRVVTATHGNGLFVSSIPNVVRPDAILFGSTLEIESPFPNPFVDEVTIRFNMPETNFVLVRIYNSSGQLVKILSNGLGFQGKNELFWDGTNTQGNRQGPGVYLVRFTYARQNYATRIVLTND
jgi:photosystem II stability/assembly factor-like uncharacterized protein